MKMILVSDIHGNWPALSAVIEREGWDEEYAVLGDIHGLVGYPSEVQNAIEQLRGVTLAGNHDKAIFHEGEGHVVSDELSRYELEHTLGALSDEQQNTMKALPYLDVQQRGPYRICYTHAMPWPEQASGYESGNSGVSKAHVASVAKAVSDDYTHVFHGHTHEQYSLDCAQWGHDVHFVNPGTLGYDGNYAVFEDGEVALKSVEVDWDEVMEHIWQAMGETGPHPEAWL